MKMSESPLYNNSTSKRKRFVSEPDDDDCSGNSMDNPSKQVRVSSNEGDTAAPVTDQTNSVGSVSLTRFLSSEVTHLKDKLEKQAVDKVESLKLALEHAENRKRDVVKLENEALQMLRKKLDEAEKELDQMRKERKEEIPVSTSDISRTDDNLHLTMKTEKASSNGNDSEPCNRPEDAMLEVFRNIRDPKTLLKCRLVCKAWKEVIDNSAEIQRRLTYKIIHPVLFCMLDISSHAKSIVFKDLLPTTSEELDALFREIGDSVEKIKLNFTFKTEQALQQAVLTKALTACSKLSKLEFGQLDEHFHLIRDLNRNEKLLASARITKLALNVSTGHLLSAKDVDIFRNFLLGLCYMEKLKYVGYQGYYSPPELSVVFSNIVVDHMEKYPGTLKSFESRHVRGFSSRLSLLLFAGKHGVRLSIKDKIYADLASCHLALTELLEYPSTAELPLNEPKYFNHINAGKMSLASEVRLHNFGRIHLCTNIKSLHIELDGTQNLDFLSFLRRLTSLKLKTVSATPVLMNQLSVMLPSVKTLEIDGNIFECSDALVKCFQNLVKLTLHGCFPDQTTNLFMSLVKLKKLQRLLLADIVSINSDNNFTESFMKENGEFVPVVAGFRCLRELKLKFTTNSRLTTVALKEGLNANRNLKKLSVITPFGQRKGVRKIDYEAITELGNMKKVDFDSRKYDTGLYELRFAA